MTDIRAVLAVYSGTAFPLTLLASGGGEGGAGTYQDAAASLSLTAGTTYSIQVIDYLNIPLAVTGTLSVQVLPTVVGDNFASAVALSPAASGTHAYSTVSATYQSGEPVGIDTTAPLSVWRTFTPTVTDRYHFQTDVASGDAVAAEDNYLDFWDGSSVGALTAVTDTIDGDAAGFGHTGLLLNATAGHTYYLRLYGLSDSVGTDGTTLSWAPASRPVNGSRTGAIALDVASASYINPTTAELVVDYDSRQAYDVGGGTQYHALYYTLTPPRSGTATISLNNTGVASVDIAGSPVTLTTSGDGLTSSWAITASTVYTIIVKNTSSFAPGLIGSFVVTFPPALPTSSGTASANNAFASAYAISADHVSLTTNLSAATIETGEPSLDFEPLADMGSAIGLGAQAALDATNNLLYVGGGGAAMTSFHSYDIDTDTWASLASMSTNRFEFGLAYQSGKVYAFGSNAVPASGCEVYDVGTDSWSAIASIDAGWSSEQLWAFPGSGAVIYILSIYQSGGTDFTTDVYSYNTGTNAYTLIGNHAPSWAGGGFATFLDGVIYYEEPTGLMRWYTIAGSTWGASTAVDPWHDVFDGPLAPLDGLIWRIGGWTASDLDAHVVTYDPATGAWATKALQPFTGTAEMFIAATSDAIIVGAGSTTDSNPVATYRLVEGASLKTVWFRWTPSLGPVSILTTLSPSAWAGIIEVYVGTSVAALTPVAAGLGSVDFTADGSSQYFIRLRGATSITNAVVTFLGTVGADDTSPDTPDLNPLVVTPTSSTLDTAPGSVILFVANGTPGVTVTFTIDETTLLAATLDDSGALDGITVPVPVSATGDFFLTATTADAQSATVMVTVENVVTADPIGVLVPTPPTAVQPTTGVRKWVLQDPAALTNNEYHFEVNPEEMGSPFGAKRIDFATTTAVDGARLAFEGQAEVVEWTFNGKIFSKAQYDHLLDWSQRANAIWLTDHYARAWYVYITKFSPTPRRGADLPWLHQYEMSVLILSGPVQQT